jgi:hypothetical protein
MLYQKNNHRENDLILIEKRVDMYSSTLFWLI